ncbi:ABC transporter substrate-binding protein [Pelomicrobium methylotrophicum]|uniref:ABC transporter substrate-binding protein n=2 Tax=Pelomicrobium methylotrophicum TaxID=2602750 RepID=A0A5C7EGA1_9PROT|nr:ABC transporter substrate-binding protein [Pelomicrobium methylotrophicum]
MSACWLRRYVAVWLLWAVGSIVSDNVLAEVSEVRIAQQFGVNYLPLTVMKKNNLIEKHAELAGLGKIRVRWLQFGGGGAMNDALLAGNLDFASGGVGPLLRMWDKTKGNLGVRGVAALGSMPLYLNTINPSVHSVKDFSDKDKIALPAVRVSIQAVVLQMAAAQAFGEDKYDSLDKLTVSMKHPGAKVKSGVCDAMCMG